VSDLTVAARSILLDGGAAPDLRMYQRLVSEAPVLKEAGCWLIS